MGRVPKQDVPLPRGFRHSIDGKRLLRESTVKVYLHKEAKLVRRLAAFFVHRLV